MLISQVAPALFLRIIGWVLIVMYILVIVKAIMIFMNLGSGSGGLFKKRNKNGGDGGKSNPDPNSDNVPNSDDVKKLQDQYEDFMKSNDLDPNKKGLVKFHVVDVNGNPLMRVAVQVWPSIKNKKAPEYKKFKALLKKKTTTLTLPDGFTPNFLPLSAGTWTGKAVKYHYSVGNVFNNLRKDFLWHPKTKGYEFQFGVVGDEDGKTEQVIDIVLNRDIERGTPRILDYRQIPQPKKKFDKLELIGEINE